MWSRAALLLVAAAMAAPAEAAVITFTDVTSIEFTNPPALKGVNCTIGDIDADGDLDLWVFNAGDVDDKLYRNDGTGHFEDITAAAGVRGVMGVASEFCGPLVDGNNDGLPDTCIATALGTNQTPALFYRNHGGSFEEMASALGILSNLDDTSVAWGDVDNDGYLDIYLASIPHSGSQNRPFLYMSESGQHYTDEWAVRGLDFTGGGAKASHLFFDWEDDGDMDLYIGAYYDFDFNNERDRLYRNDGTGHFTFAPGAISPEAVPTTAVQLADFDGDGRLDIFALGEQTPNNVWRDNGDGTFTDIASSLNLRMPSAIIGGDPERKSAAVVSDFDNDMDPDVFVTNWALLLGGEPRDRLMMNEGGVYVERAFTAGIREQINDFACAAADFNGDGFLDLYVVNDNDFGTRDTLFQSNGNGNHWIEIDPRGVVSNRDAFGLRAWVTSGSKTQVQELFCHSAHPSRLHFGLASNETVAELKLRWPSGLVEFYHDLPADQVFRPIEGAATTPSSAGFAIR